MWIRIIAGLMLLSSLGIAQGQSLPVANGGLTGQWFNTERAGEGFFVEIIEVAGEPQIAISWFTYDDAGNQMWLVGSAPIESFRATSVTIPVFVTDGARFGPAFDPADVNLTSWGTVSFQFTGCDSGTVTYDSDTGQGSGTIALTRLTSILDQPCVEPPPLVVPKAGLWVDVSSVDVCLWVSSDGSQVTDLGSGCGRPAPIGHAVNIEDSFTSNDINCEVDFQTDADFRIINNSFEVFVGETSIPLVRGTFSSTGSAVLVYNDGMGCSKQYALVPAR